MPLASWPRDGRHLVHASARPDLDVLEPLTDSPAGRRLYATTCPTFAAFHVWRRKYGHRLFLYRYSFLTLRFTLGVIPRAQFPALAAAPVSLYFLEKDGFEPDARLVGLLEKTSLGYIRNSNVEYVSRQALRPARKAVVTLPDLLPGKPFGLFRHLLYFRLA